MIKETLNIINNKKLRNYKFKYIKGIIGLIIGSFLYVKNRRFEHKPMAYISYFIVRSITGEEPK